GTVVAKVMTNRKGAFKLLPKLGKCAATVRAASVTGAARHFATPKAEGTTVEKINDVLTNGPGGGLVKFAEDLDDLGVPTMNTSFKHAKIQLETIGRDGERLLMATISVLKPNLRKTMLDKVMAN